MLNEKEQELLSQVYANLEEARLMIWPALCREYVNGGIVPSKWNAPSVIKLPSIKVESFENGVKATIAEVFPHKQGNAKKDLVRAVWSMIVTRLVNRIEQKFANLHITIAGFLPGDNITDIDEQIVMLLVHNLKKFLVPRGGATAFTVILQTDIENPRTELYLAPFPSAWNSLGIVKEGGAYGRS